MTFPDSTISKERASWGEEVRKSSLPQLRLCCSASSVSCELHEMSREQTHSLWTGERRRSPQLALRLMKRRSFEHSSGCTLRPLSSTSRLPETLATSLSPFCSHEGSRRKPEDRAVRSVGLIASRGSLCSTAPELQSVYPARLQSCFLYWRAPRHVRFADPAPPPLDCFNFLLAPAVVGRTAAQSRRKRLRKARESTRRQAEQDLARCVSSSFCPHRIAKDLPGRTAMPGRTRVTD